MAEHGSTPLRPEDKAQEPTASQRAGDGASGLGLRLGPERGARPLRLPAALAAWVSLACPVLRSHSTSCSWGPTSAKHASSLMKAWKPGHFPPRPRLRLQGCRGALGRRHLGVGLCAGSAIYCPLIAPRTRLAHKAFHAQQWRFSQQLTRNNIVKPFTKTLLFTIN